GGRAREGRGCRRGGGRWPAGERSRAARPARRRPRGLRLPRRPARLARRPRDRRPLPQRDRPDRHRRDDMTPLFRSACTAALLMAASPALAADKLTLMLDWFVNPDHAPIVLAEEKGFFADAGLEVEVVSPANPSDPPKLVAAGKVDLAVGYQPQLHLQVHEGLPLVRVGTLVGTPLNCLMVMSDGPIETIADLEGRRIGFSVAG